MTGTQSGGLTAPEKGLQGSVSVNYLRNRPGEEAIAE